MKNRAKIIVLVGIVLCISLMSLVEAKAGVFLRRVNRVQQVIVPKRIQQVVVANKIQRVIVPNRIQQVVVANRIQRVIVPNRIQQVVVPYNFQSVIAPKRITRIVEVPNLSQAVELVPDGCGGVQRVQRIIVNNNTVQKIVTSGGY